MGLKRSGDQKIWWSSNLYSNRSTDCLTEKIQTFWIYLFWNFTKIFTLILEPPINKEEKKLCCIKIYPLFYYYYYTLWYKSTALHCNWPDFRAQEVRGSNYAVPQISKILLFFIIYSLFIMQLSGADWPWKTIRLACLRKN